MIFPSFDRVKAIAPGYDIVPVYMEILSDVRTPISVLKALKQVSSHTYLLESADNSNHWGRYSFLGYDPKIELFCKNHKMTIKDGTWLLQTTTGSLNRMRGSESDASLCPCQDGGARRGQTESPSGRSP